MSEQPLFPGFEPPLVEPPEKQSADRRRTRRQRQDVSNGVHPLMRTPLHPEATTRALATDRRGLPFTCGSCVHRQPSEGDHSWPKCGIGPRSGGPATDCRAWWPACTKYDPAPPNTNPSQETA